MRTIDGHILDEAEIRSAERRLETALQAPDPTAWVLVYTEDAVFDGGGDHAVQGRAGLLEMAEAMRPLSAVSIRPSRDAPQLLLVNPLVTAALGLCALREAAGHQIAAPLT